MTRPEVTGRKFLGSRAVATRYGVTPRSIARWVRAQRFPQSDAVVCGRHYWIEASLDRHDRQCVTERATMDNSPTPTPASPD
jgi:hypothetical protein